MDKLEASGITSYVGKVNMDRNGGVDLEEDTAQSAADTRRWLADVDGRYDHTAPIITPRFTPSVTDELMGELASDSRRVWPARPEPPFREPLGVRLGQGAVPVVELLWRRV